MLFSGGFDEPYCSSSCYKQAGNEITNKRMAGQSGQCAFCQTDVYASLSNPGDCVFFPFKQSLLFVCKSCLNAGKAFTDEITECCMCGNLLDKKVSAESVDNNQSHLVEFADAKQTQVKKGSTAEKFGFLAWSASLV